VLICISLGKRNAAVGDDGAVPVSAGGSERAEFLAAAQQVDTEAAGRVLGVQQAAGDNRARSGSIRRPRGPKAATDERPSRETGVVRDKEPLLAVGVQDGWGGEEIGRPVCRDRL